VKEARFANSPAVCIEIRQGVLEALRGDEGLELPLERSANGELTAAARENVTRRLREFLRKEVWQPRMRAYCAIGARGVSLRRLSLPPSTKENFPRLLALQIENEFPLPPDALAWGYRLLRNGEVSNQRGAGQELLVVAVKKEVVAEYSEILAECGVVPVFTIAALARREACQQPPPTSAVLDLGREYSELVSFEHNLPVAVRVLPWGDETLIRSMAEKLGVTADEAAKLAEQGSDGSNRGPQIQAAMEGPLDSLAAAVNNVWTGQKIFLSGRAAGMKGFAPDLERRLKGGAQCEVLQVSPGEGHSAATLGLRRALAEGGEFPLMTLQSKPANGNVALAKRVPWKWVAVAAALLLAMLALPYARAILFKGRLSRRLAAVEAQRGRLTMVDHELEFLRYLKQNQPPYLDALFLLSKAAPQGTKFESISMNRTGDLALRGTMRDATQVAALRTKLIDSGFFSSVGVEEQTPSPDHQKVTVRMAAQWKSANDRAALAIGPTAEDLEKAKNHPKDPPPGAFPMMGGPMPPMPAMPGGMPMPARGKRMPVPGKAGTDGPAPAMPTPMPVPMPPGP
jgi:Tfp pilus assembly PilM family ATPase